MLCHAGSHSSSTVHLHGYLDMLMFRDDIYGHVRQPTHASAACSKHTFVFSTNVFPDNWSRGHTWWGSHQRRLTCTLDEISFILKGNSNYAAFVKSAQGSEMTSDAIDNWCCIQGTRLQGNTALGPVICLSSYHRMLQHVCTTMVRFKSQ